MQRVDTHVSPITEELEEGDIVMWLHAGKHLKHSKVMSKMYLNNKLMYEAIDGKLVRHDDALKYSSIHPRRTL